MVPTERPAARMIRRFVVAGLFGAACVAFAFTASATNPPGQQPAPAPTAADPVYTKDVAPILYDNCTTCHRPGGIGPFSLMDYESAKANAGDIRDVVSKGIMPPWHATGPHGVFSNDRRLTDAQKQTIVRWAAAGAPQGDRRFLPPTPRYSSDWEMGIPDAVVAMPEAFHVPASGTIEYQYFEVPTDFGEDKWVTAIEVMPGARDVVHHVIVFARPAPAARPAPGTEPASRPAGTPAPRPVLVRNPAHEIPDRPARLDTRHPPPDMRGATVAGTAVGTNVMRLPPGTALRLTKGSILTFQMHYTTQGREAHDRTSVGFRFTDQPPDDQIFMNSFLNGSFVLPAGQASIAVPAEIGFNEPVRIYGLLPHTHLRGKRWKYELHKPDGTSEVILDVPHYDFNWQTYYFFAKPLEVPAGAKIVSTAWYDNSASNPNNPDASKDVRWGDQTWEEMQFTGFLYSVNSRRRSASR